MLAGRHGGGRRAGHSAPLRQNGRKQRGAILGGDNSVCRHAFELGEQRGRIELVDGVEIRSGEGDVVTPVEPRGPYLRDVTTLWTDDENSLHVAGFCPFLYAPALSL